MAKNAQKTTRHVARPKILKGEKRALALRQEKRQQRRARARGTLQALAGKRWYALNANQRWSVVEAALTALGYLDDGVVTIPDDEV